MQALAIARQILVTVILINAFLSFFIVFFGRRKPSTTWVWLMVVAFIPLFGFFVYLIFGQDTKKHKKFRRKCRNDKKITAKLIETLYGGYFGQYFTPLKENEPNSFTALINHNLNVDGGYLTNDNAINIFNNGADKYESLLADIAKAKRFIHMQYYIIRDDATGARFVSALAKKAREGVTVRLLYDGMGCIKNRRNFFAPLIAAGGKTANFFPPIVPSFWLRVNYRNHRKAAVIDGETAYIGGINIGDEYLGASGRFGFWRDMAARIEGGAVNQVQLRFIKDWNFAVRKTSDAIAIEDKYFIKHGQDCSGNTKLQILSSGPDTDYDNVKNLYFKMINKARKSLYFTTPYFVPDDSILTALKVAALSGIDVRLIFPAKPDHPFVYWASLSYVSELLSAGVKCYQYRKESGFIHSKMLIMDGKVSTIGTANMDIRSFDLNFETIAVIYDDKVGALLNEQFYIDQTASFEITNEWYYSRPKVYRFYEAFSRLISPIL